MGSRYMAPGHGGVLDTVSKRWLSDEEKQGINPDEIKAAKQMGDYLISPDGVVRLDGAVKGGGGVGLDRGK